MLNTINSKDELLLSIEKDKISNLPSDKRYPIRLIFVNNFRTLNSVVKDLNKQAKLIELSSFLPHDDGWLTPDELIRKIREISTTALVVPFSEVLRFTKPDVFNSILISLFEIENLQQNPEKRIYIPMLGLWDRFQKEFYENFHRKNEWATVWKIDEQVEKRITIYQTNFPIVTNQTLLKTSSDWLNLWKRSKIKLLISCSLSLGYLYKNFLPDTIFRMEELTNYKDVIESVLAIKVPIEYSEKEIDYWKRFLKELELKANINEYVTFEHYLCDYLNIKNIFEMSNMGMLKCYVDKYKKYDRWLLKSWILSHGKYKKNYLYHVLSETKYYTNDELIRLTWLKIFRDIKYSKDNFRERKEMINYLFMQSSFSYSLIESELSVFLKNIEKLPFHKQANYLTSITQSEREHIINQLLKQDDFFKNIPMLKKIYPELYYYLSWDMPLDEIDEENWIKDYFQEYCLSKLLDKPTEKLIKIINTKNSNEDSFYNWYYKIKSYPEIKKAKIIWIDGLGAEWLSLLYYIINENLKDSNKAVTKNSIVKVNLPSITDCNRFSDAEHVLDFDKFIHQENPYKHPQSLIEQIELIKTIVKNKILKYPDSKIIIVSDHGFTFLAQKKYGNIKKFDFEHSEHEGRCLWTEKEFKSDSNFLYHTIDRGHYKNKNVLISLKYTSLQNTPYREVHGGATPEEVLVPYIEISTIQEKIEYSVELLSTEFSSSSPTLKIIIVPELKMKPYLVLDKKEYSLYKEKNYWCANLTGLSPKNYKAKVYVGHKYYPISFQIKGGIEEEELF